MKTKRFQIVLTVALGWLAATTNVLGVSACLSARFTDYRDFGCRLPPDPWHDLTPDNQRACDPCGGVAGMPRWWVSEPYINLWVADEPLSYPTSSGQRMSFRWTHRQRTPALPREYTSAGTIPIRLKTKNSYYGTECTPVSVMKDAQWCHNWWSEIVLWDTYQETNYPPLNAYSYDTSTNPAPKYFPYSPTYNALVMLGDGGTVAFEGATATQPNGERKLRLEVIGALSALGGPRIPKQYSEWNPYPTNSQGIVWVENPQYGFRLMYPDGSQDVYGFVLLVGSKPICTDPYPYTLCVGWMNNTTRAYLTQRIDAQGRVTRLGYEKLPVTAGQPAYIVRYIVDADGRTNTYHYNPSNRNQLTSLEDPYGRSADLYYDAVEGLLTNITDAAGLSSSFQYVTQTVSVTNINFVTGQCNGSVTAHQVPVSGWLASITTPYGTNSFSYFQDQEAGATDEYTARAMRVTEPENAHQLYYYRHRCDNLVPSSATAPTNVPGAAFDAGSTGSQHPELYYRNSFHWDRRQFAALSINDWSNFGYALSILTTNDYSKGTMQHWLLGSDLFSVTGSVSSQRDPSPDAAGQIEGARTWYDYAGKNSSEPQIEGTEILLKYIARTLPDGTSQYTGFDYTTEGYPSKQRETFTQTNGTVAVRTNIYTYAANGVDFLNFTNAGTRQLSAAYNTNHQVTFITNALNEVTTVTYTDLLTEQKPHVITFPSGQTVTLDYYKGAWTNINGTNVYVWLPDARFLKSIQWSPGPAWNLGYDKGLVKNATNDLGLVLNFTWDDLLRLTSVSFPDTSYISNRYDKLDLTATRDRLGNWTYAGYDALQHLTAITNANNAVTRLSWCDCGALASVTDALTNVTSLYYNNQGLLTNVAFADNSSVKYSFDALGRMTNVMDGLNRSLKVGYNNQGLVTTVSNAYGPLESIVYDALNRPSQITDANNVTVTNSYDLLNRLTTRMWADGFGESYGWSTNGLTAYTNRNAKVTRFTRDAAGRLTAVTNANQEVTRVALNSLGQVTDLFDALNHHTQWTYDEYGRRRSKQDALGRTTSWDYNANGWLTNRALPQSGNTAYAYDAVGNLTNIAYPSSSIAYAFNVLNQLTNMVDAVGTNRFTWTAAGRLASEDGPWNDDTVSFSYTEGLRTAMSVGSAWSQSYGYDSAWRMTSLTSPAGSFGYDFGGTSSASSLIKTLSLPNHAYITNHYDTLGRFDYTGLANRWGHVLDGYGYIHDPLGLRTNLTRDFGLTTSSAAIGYDNIGQLISWIVKEAGSVLRQNEQLGWDYDDAGNLRYRTNNALIQTFTVDPINGLTNIARTGTLTVSGATPAPASSVTVNGLTADRYGDFTFARTNNTLANGNNTFTNIAQNVYGLSATNTLTVNLPTSVNLSSDLNGNLTNDGLRSFAYDAENQLVTNWVSGAWKTEHAYDGFGRRRVTRDYGWQSGSWVKTNEVHYVCDGFLPIQERDANNTTFVTYTRGLDLSGSLEEAGGIGGLLARTDANSSTFYHADGSGNITALLDSRGDVVARYLYSPFGKLVGQWGALAPANVMQFSSMPQLRGISFYPLRPYEPNLQQFLTEDPIGEAGGINLHGFVGNSPLNVIDPFGLWLWMSPDGKVHTDMPPSERPVADPNTFGGMHGYDTDWMGGARPGDFVADNAKEVIKKSLEMGAMFTPFGGEKAAAEGLGASKGLLGKIWSKCKNVFKRPPPIKPFQSKAADLTKLMLEGKKLETRAKIFELSKTPEGRAMLHDMHVLFSQARQAGASSPKADMILQQLQDWTRFWMQSGP